MTVGFSVLSPAQDQLHGQSIIPFFITNDSRFDNPNDSRFETQKCTHVRVWQYVLPDNWTDHEIIFSHLKKRFLNTPEQNSSFLSLFSRCFFTNMITVFPHIFSVSLALALCVALSHFLNRVI